MSQGATTDLPKKSQLEKNVEILETLFSDSTRYVVRSVANHLNDISKKNDGTLILRGYSKPTNIGMGGGTSGTVITNGSANQAYGGGIVWSKSFNSLFKKNKKDKKTVAKIDSVKTDSVISTNK